MNPQGHAQSFTCDIKCHPGQSDSDNLEGNMAQKEQTPNLEFNLIVKTNRTATRVSLIDERFFVLQDRARFMTSVYKSSEIPSAEFHELGISNGSEIPESKTESLLLHIPSETENKSAWQRKFDHSKHMSINQFKIFSTRSLSEEFPIHRSPCNMNYQCQAERCNLTPVNGEFPVVEMLETQDEFMTVQFWTLFLLIVVSSVTMSAIFFQMDTVCYEILKDRGDKYGEQRLWGTIGWGLGALAGGYLNQIISTSSTKIDYAPSFYLLTALTALDMIPIYQLKVDNVKYSSNICRDVAYLLSKMDVVVNIIMVYAIGVLSGLIWNYQFWFMEEIGSSQVLLGLSQTFECIVAEVPCFLISGWLIRKVGYLNCNSITLLCFALRYLSFAYMYNPWMTLPVGLLHGPTFGIFYASMTMYAKTKAPPGTEASVQSLMSMAFEGVGEYTLFVYNIKKTR